MTASERYNNIIIRAPKKSQHCIVLYVDAVEETHTPSEVRELYNVRNLKELVQHLVEFECGTSYDIEQQPIQDYLLFKEALECAKDDVDKRREIRQSLKGLGAELHERETTKEREKIHLPCASCGRPASTTIEGKPYCLMCAKAVV